MFDVGFSELILIGIVALVIFGPEDLPRVARTVGHLLGKFRRYVADVKSDISREMELADVKRLHDELKDGARSLQDSLNEQARSLEAGFHQSVADFQQEVVAEPATPAPNAPAEPFELTAELPPEGLATPPEREETDESQLDLFGNPASTERKA